MKYKVLLPIIFAMQVFGFVMTASVLAGACIEGVEKTLSDIKQMPLFIAGLIIFTIVLLIGIFLSLTMMHKVEKLTEIEGEQERLEKETEKYKQATTEFVKTFKIQSPNLL